MKIWLSVLLLISLLFFAFLLFLIYKTNKNDGKTFNFCQYFIYEAFAIEDKKGIILRIVQGVFLLVNVGIAVTSYFLPNDKSVTSANYFLMIALFEVVVCLLWVLLSSLSFKKEKIRVAAFMFYGAFIAIRNGTVGFILLSISRKTIENTSILSLTFAVLSFVFAALALLPLLNPKLSNYAKMDRIIEKDGTVSYQRPKYFVMAFSEWLLTFLDEISFLATIIFFLVAL